MVLIKAILRLVKEQDLQHISGKMEIDIKECFRMTKRMDMANYTTLKVNQSTKELGKMIK